MHKLKVILSILIILLIVGSAGWVYYTHVSSFDNKAQYKSGMDFYNKNNFQESYVAFLRVKFFSKYHKAALFRQILSAEKLGDWPIVENKAKIFVAQSSDNTFAERAEYLLAKSYFMNKKYLAAQEAFTKIKSDSKIEDYRHASDYFLGKIAFQNNDFQSAKKHYFEYLKNTPAGTYSLAIAYDTMNMVLAPQESTKIAKVFLANQKYDETMVVLKDVPKFKSWIYLAMVYFYKNDFGKFNKIAEEGYTSMASGIISEDLKEFTDFYLAIQSNYQNELKKLRKLNVNKVIPDYFLYKAAQFESEDKKIKLYKEIVKNYPKSEYIPDCLVAIFFDFGNKAMYNSAIRIGNIFLDKFSDNPQSSQILFWTAKYLDRLQYEDEAKRYFKRLIEKYPDSYYSYRASKAGMNSIASWSFSHVQLPDSKEFSVDFPFEEVSINDAAFIKLFFELDDIKILEEIPLDNLAVKSWCEYKKGNAAKSVYYANKYISENRKNLPYSNPVWKLAFPIYYSDYINENSAIRNVDPFLILSLIREESHFVEDARSSSNAMGLMQLMMPTASYIAELRRMQAPDGIKLNDPKYNIELGTAYFAYVLDATSNNTMYAIGGYNGGPNAMNKWKEKFKMADTDEFVEKIPYAESKNYIKKVFRSRYNYAQIYGAY